MSVNGNNNTHKKTSKMELDGLWTTNYLNCGIDTNKLLSNMGCRYIYTDNIEITSMDKACELCYVAKKYMLPLVVQQCTEYLWSDLDAKNVCRAFEFAKLFEEPELAERCLQVR